MRNEININKKKNAGTLKLVTGALKECIKAAMEEHNVTRPIPQDTVCSRAKRQNPHGPMTTPMEDIEPHLCAATKEHAHMGQLLDETSFLKFANSIIQGTDTEDEMVQWKRKCSLRPGETGEVLGRKRYKIFVKRHKDELEKAKAHSADINRRKWSTHGNFKFVHERICTLLVER